MADEKSHPERWLRLQQHRIKDKLVEKGLEMIDPRRTATSSRPITYF
jgi:hypothetical protein